MSLLHKFSHHLSLSMPDPLGGGLAEEIAAERAEPDAIELDNAIDVSELQDRWRSITEEFENDPEWSSLMSDG